MSCKVECWIKVTSANANNSTTSAGLGFKTLTGTTDDFCCKAKADGFCWLQDVCLESILNDPSKGVTIGSLPPSPPIVSQHTSSFEHLALLDELQVQHHAVSVGSP